jgi:hypothetical protein
MVTNEESPDSFDESGTTVILNLFDSQGNGISTQRFSGFGRDFSTSSLSNNYICFLGVKNPFQEGKKLNFKILNSNLDVISERNIGSLDNTGTFGSTCHERANFYYIYGVTDSADGDFDLPNNSTGTDLFLYRLNK